MTDTVAQLQASLAHEVNLVQEFIGILEREAEALAQPSGNDVLAETTGQKNGSAERLAQAAETRHALLIELGYSADKAGLEAAAEAHPALQDGASALYKLAGVADELNTANGITIDTFLAHNQQALDTLRSLAGIGNLYDASGRTRPGAKGAKTSIKAG